MSYRVALLYENCYDYNRVQILQSAKVGNGHTCFGFGDCLDKKVSQK